MVSEESIRCPMCGILNPADNVHCESCGARLEPLNAPLNAPRSSDKPQSDRDINSGYSVARMGSAEEPADQMPLKGPSLPGSAVEDTSRSPIPSAASKSGDWLSDLRASVPDEVYDLDDTGRPADVGEGDKLPGWLDDDISVADAISPGPAPAGDAVFDGLMPGDGELPDWLQEMRPLDDTSPDTDESGDSDDVIISQRESIFAVSDDDSDGLELSTEDEWKGTEAALERSAAAEVSDQVKLPDWLRQTASTGADIERQNAVDEVSVEPGVHAEGDADDLPEWLREVTQSVDRETGDLATKESPVFRDGERFSDPSILPHEGTGVEPDAVSHTNAVEQEGRDVRVFRETGQLSDLPDWIDRVVPTSADYGTKPADDGMPESTAAPELTNLPDWLREIMPTEVSEELRPPSIQADSDTEAAQQGESLDWLGGTLPAAAPEVTDGTQLVSDISDIGPTGTVRAGSTPEMASGREPGGLGSALEETASSDAVARPALESPESGEVPGWLRDLVSSAQSQGSRKDEPVALASEMQYGAAVRSMDDAPVFDTQDDSGLATALGLSQADIPEWLEALRPDSESLESDLEEEPVEIGGILDGLRGALPTASAMETIHTHVNHESIETPDSTLARAQLLQGLLARTPQVTRSAPGQHRTGSGIRIGRWLVVLVIAAVVFATLIWPYLTGVSPQLTRLQVEMPGADSVFGFVNGLGPSDIVLVAFEYGPGEAEELDLLATAVLGHIVAQGSRIRIVSTRPEGSAMAVNVMEPLAPDDAGAGWYDHIGYRPGGAVAISQLLSASDIDTAAVLVLTANPSVLRWWVEQSRLPGGNIPVAACIGAGLEPVAGPYFAGGAQQLAGVVSGLTGAAYYEQILLGVSGQASHRLDALAAGHLAVAGLIVIGALIHGPGRAGRKGE